MVLLEGNDSQYIVMLHDASATKLEQHLRLFQQASSSHEPNHSPEIRQAQTAGKKQRARKFCWRFLWNEGCLNCDINLHCQDNFVWLALPNCMLVLLFAFIMCIQPLQSYTQRGMQRQTYLDASSGSAEEQYFAGGQSSSPNSAPSCVHCSQGHGYLSQVVPQLLLGSWSSLQALRARLRLHVSLLQCHCACMTNNNKQKDFQLMMS